MKKHLCQIMFMLGLCLSSQAFAHHPPMPPMPPGPPMTMNVSCWARTTCYAPGMFGEYRPIGEISCQTMGQVRVSRAQPGRAECSFNVLPATAVSCRGQEQRFDQWGRRYWAWREINMRCPGR